MLLKVKCLFLNVSIFPLPKSQSNVLENNCDDNKNLLMRLIKNNNK